MGKRKRWQIAGYDGAGSRIMGRAVPRGDTERAERQDVPHKARLRRMLAQSEQHEQDHEVRLTFGLPVR